MTNSERLLLPVGTPGEVEDVKRLDMCGKYGQERSICRLTFVQYSMPALVNLKVVSKVLVVLRRSEV